jgi:hypothetical protein
MPRFTTLVLCATLGACPLAMAQVPQNGAGFFPPTPGNDPSLSRTLAPESYPGVVPAPGTVIATPVAPAPTPAQTAAASAPAPAPAADRAVAAEGDMDKSGAEARQAREATMRSPQPINGAFTGLTDERDR